MKNLFFYTCLFLSSLISMAISPLENISDQELPQSYFKQQQKDSLYTCRLTDMEMEIPIEKPGWESNSRFSFERKIDSLTSQIEQHLNKKVSTNISLSIKAPEKRKALKRRVIVKMKGATLLRDSGFSTKDQNFYTIDFQSAEYFLKVGNLPPVKIKRKRAKLIANVGSGMNLLKNLTGN